MKLAVSNIAWTNEEEIEVAEKLQSLGVKYVEIAPTKIWADPAQASDTAIEKYRSFWENYGIEIIAFQSMLFSRPDLKIFEGTKNRAETLAYLQNFIKLAGKMGVQCMVFGSPKNRQTNGLADGEVQAIARNFFDALGTIGSECGVCFCIEPNPTDYACDFIVNAKEGIEFVRSVGNAGFGLHLDIAGMTLAKDDIAESIKNAQDILRHFHISSPFLEQVEDREDVQHGNAARALRAISYDGFVSTEMRPAQQGENQARVEKAVKFAQQVYVD